MSRVIFSTSRRGRAELQDLLQTIFVAELLAPSCELWLVSPWITNIAVINDSSGRFRVLNESGRSRLYLVDVLARLLQDGTRVVVVTRPKESGAFLSALRNASKHLSADRLAIIERDTLHAKGLVGDHYCVWGSMNFTWSGTSRWEELVEVADGVKVNEILAEFRQEYRHGGA
jgi:phosphatidylserine/phosphatidylglycerophosphate/cardiolipin synthase-like enzyme